MSPHRNGPGSRITDESGFTLLETLVAFVVLATILSVLFRGVVGIRAGANAFDTHSEADLVARAIFEETLAKRDLQTGIVSGLRNGHRWTVRATSVDLASQLPPPPPPDSQPSGAQQAGAQQAGAQPTDSQNQKPTWTPQRLVVRVETDGRPIEIETIRLVKAP